MMPMTIHYSPQGRFSERDIQAAKKAFLMYDNSHQIRLLLLMSFDEGLAILSQCDADRVNLWLKELSQHSPELAHSYHIALTAAPDNHYALPCWLKVLIALGVFIVPLPLFY